MNPYTNSVLVHLDTNYVKIDHDKIYEWSKKLYNQDMVIPNWREPVFPEDDISFVEFIGVANAINFCFKNPYGGDRFDVEYKGKLYRGSFAMAACLMRALDEGIPILDPDFLSDIRLTMVQNIFRPANNPIPLMNERADYLSNVGTVLKQHKLSFLKIIQSTEARAFRYGDGFVEKLVNLFSCYRDVVLYKGHYLHFAKRVQLMAMVYHGRAMDSRYLMPLSDPESIGPISDYVVPQNLRYMKILQYDESLSYDIENEKILEGGSDKEVEIRMKTVEAVHLLLELINDERRINGLSGSINMAQLDYLLWSQKNDKSKHHLTPTTAY